MAGSVIIRAHADRTRAVQLRIQRRWRRHEFGEERVSGWMRLTAFPFAVTPALRGGSSVIVSLDNCDGELVRRIAESPVSVVRPSVCACVGRGAAWFQW